MWLDTTLHVLAITLLASHVCGYSDVTGRYTREIRIKQGALRGVIVEPSLVDNLPNVEAFLGIEYAAPPIGTQRFMPPASPPPWSGVKMAESFAPVCPQSLPDFASEPGKHMSEARYNSLKRLLPYLSNQSEACLSLNIYAPQSAGSRDRASAHRYPVLVFIHGESYEWNSGNPYDGSVLASYGGVVVVTVNYRLGILGFLKPGLGEHVLSNFGLLDQVAALQWVKDNIAQFNGDPSSVTVMGHGTGAACANLLLVSPVANGLFHRAILMSGSALSDWALTSNPIQFTIQVAESLNCPANDELAGCLRKKRLSEIMRVKVQAPPFRTPFGPVVDGSVVINEPSQTMGVYRDLFSRYELLYGVTEVESYHLLDAVALQLGMLERERDQRLRDYMQARFELAPDTALAAALREYSPRRPISEMHRDSRPMAEQHRDSLLEALSDAMVASPVSKMADLHSAANPKSYFYVFAHASKHGDFAEASVGGAVHGEELPYVFGVPMNSGRFPQSFTQQEKLFSEAVITYWTNFAKTGNPNAPRRASFLTQGPREWRQYDIDWPEYDVINQTYLNLGIPPKFGHHYRKPQMNFWNTVLPSQLKQPALAPPRLLGAGPPHLRDILPPPWSRPKDRYENFHKPTTYGKVVHEIDDSPGESSSTQIPSSPPREAGSAALGLVVIVGVCFLVVNVCVFAALFYQRRRIETQTQEGRALESRAHESRGLESRAHESRATLDLEMRAQQPGVDAHAKVCEWIVQRCDATARSDTVEPRPETPDTPDTVTRMSEADTVVPREVFQARHNTARTQDTPRTDNRGPTTTQNAEKPGNVNNESRAATQNMETNEERKQNNEGSTETKQIHEIRDIVAKTATPQSNEINAATPQNLVTRTVIPQSNETNAATPQNNVARSTVQNQEVRVRPSKSRENLLREVHEEKQLTERKPGPRDQFGAREIPREMATQVSMEEGSRHNVSIDSTDSLPTHLHELPERRRKVKKVSVAVDATPAARSASVQKQTPIEVTKSLESVALKISHAHSRSAPEPIDVNVTSREEVGEEVAAQCSDPVANMRRRNFPKVLPDLDKRRSLGARQPPLPPPRVSSTLGRVVKPPRIVIKATPVKRGNASSSDKI